MKAAEIYGPYQKALRENHALDFDDLLILYVGKFVRLEHTLNARDFPIGLLVQFVGSDVKPSKGYTCEVLRNQGPQPVRYLLFIMNCFGRFF